VIATVRATRYVTPLREGGSLPGIVEADDFGTYVVKFRGAGQGLKVLVAEVIVGELGRRLGLRVPELRAIELDPAIARYEADEEVQDLLSASTGSNLGVDFLPGSFAWDVHHRTDPDEAGAVLWLDAFTANVDRSWRNPNVLIWHRQLWLIDHGAALYFHHGWASGLTSPDRFAAQTYDASDHLLIAHVDQVRAADVRLAHLVTEDLLVDVLDQVPADWIDPVPGLADAAAVRRAYIDFLLARVNSARTWLPSRVAA
jgi:hypothetical protein